MSIALPSIEEIRSINSGTSKDQYDLNQTLRELVESREYSSDPNSYTDHELDLMEFYSGMGGLHKHGAKGTGILSEFYTPDSIVKVMWGLAYKHGFLGGENRHVLEPSFGIGRFFKYLPKGTEVTGFEVDPYAFAMAVARFKRSHGKDYPATFRKKRFEQHFVKLGKSLNPVPEFDLVLANPPYEPFVSEYSDLEKVKTKAHTFDQYFLARSIDVCNPGGLVIMIIPSTFLRNDQKYNELKEMIIRKADLIEAFRLPIKSFDDTDVGTDIVVFRRK